MTFSLPTDTGKERNSFQQWKAVFVRAGGCGGGEGKDVLCTFVALDA